MTGSISLGRNAFILFIMVFLFFNETTQSGKEKEIDTNLTIGSNFVASK